MACCEGSSLKRIMTLKFFISTKTYLDLATIPTSTILSKIVYTDIKVSKVEWLRCYVYIVFGPNPYNFTNLWPNLLPKQLQAREKKTIKLPSLMDLRLIASSKYTVSIRRLEIKRHG